ncbi:hypothetical protein GCM10025868_20640 [Angustibacter aerolatus]|uniref:Pterin-binding domain-containing protein n=1 Tax=Angustibacter aerolatus TaxID=1162965 RepID=A0ABQ6JHH2_9ACTN|nr:dihydropteroate synthase [Angustibacter aerolatus]GMA86814.1 hypothetical protein GCM10025868_20640 [Angustibacter aerolatus]
MPQPLAVPVGLGVRTVGRQTIDLDRRPLVMAIVNRTRDSFFDGGRTFALDAATAAVERAVADGADWVDVGAVPFSPDAERVDEAEELDRLLPVVAAARATGDVIVSVETTRPAVARAAFAAGADVLNDTSGLHDPEPGRRHGGGRRHAGRLPQPGPAVRAPAPPDVHRRRPRGARPAGRAGGGRQVARRRAPRGRPRPRPEQDHPALARA